MDSYTIEIRSSDLDISKINEKIYKLKQIINKINDSNQFLEYTKNITFENLEQLNNSDNIFNLIKNVKNYNLDKCIEKLKEINYNDNKIKERYILIVSYICSSVNEELNSYENKINNMPDILKKNICNDNILSKLNFERKNLEFCLSILKLYFSMEGYFSDEFYLSKDLNNIYSEVYTIGLEILNLRKIKEDELRLIYEEYINYKNILNLLNYYQKKKLFF
jgi:hypothetical protein